IKEDDPDAAAGIFNDLVNTAKESLNDGANLSVIRSIAGDLSSQEDKNLSRRLFGIYGDKLIEASPLPDDLKENAMDFLGQGNVYLAKKLFEAYLGTFGEDKAARAKATVEIAGLFANKDTGEAIDPVYAEELYKKSFDGSGMQVFDESAQYRRAFNLERMKENGPASTEYKNLLSNYKDYEDKYFVLFRLGVLSAYALRQTETSMEYFSMVADGSGSPSLVLSSIYQLGLLNHYGGDLAKAEGFYAAILEKAKSFGIDVEKDEICRMAQERLVELTEKKEIKYGLKLYLDAIFKRSDETVLPINVDLTANPPKETISKDLRLLVTTSNSQTGCMTPTYSYQWSGQTGVVSNIPNVPELTTNYPEDGIKVVQVVVLGPQGPEGAAFDMVEIQGSGSSEQGTVKASPENNTQTEPGTQNPDKSND
ncbi:MAG TPA: hypothetical protein PLU24_01150, partial [Candidatus Omnitrophota bacterium]|nr:hypothetical protein [Candidatus Omnitrophota bacterium]